MTARLRYPELAPEGYAALQAFGHYVNTGTALETVLLGLVYLRASVLNGCTFCTELHAAELRKHHEPESRIGAVAADAPGADVFTPRELAALRWTDVMTRLGEAGAPDEEYGAVARFFEGKDLVDLTFAIANINAWNRMGVAFRPEWRPRAAGVGAGHAEGSASGEAVVGEVAAASAAGTAKGAAGAEDDGGKAAND